MENLISSEILEKIKANYSGSKDQITDLMCVSAAIFGYSLALDQIKDLEIKIRDLEKQIQKKNQGDTTFY